MCSYEYCKIFKNIYFYRIPPVAASVLETLKTETLFGLKLSTGKRPSTRNLFTCARDMELDQSLTCHLNFLKI